MKLNVGEYVKVHLPGEWPFAIVTAVHHETVIQARIDNHLASGLHNFAFGDVLTFQYRGTPQMPDRAAWEVAPAWEQMPTGPRAVETDAPPALSHP